MYLDLQIKIKVHFLRNKKINLVKFSFYLPFSTENQSRREIENFKKLMFPVDELSPLDADGIF